jgi:hypothetical protein
MTSCSAVERNLETLAARRPEDLPDEVREHVGACPACARRLAASRLARGLVASVTEGTTPPTGFAQRVTTAIAARAGVGRPEPDVWRPAWGLLPTFAAAVAALVIVYQSSEAPLPSGLFPTEGLSAGERLVLGVSAPDADDVLTAVLEGVAK